MGKSIRKLIAVLVFFVVVFPLSAAQGVLWGEKDIRVVKTQWFDIIYPLASAQSAAILAEKADVIYYEIADLYGHEPHVRMPVVLTPNVEQYNAYFSTGYYNRIVLYDTAVNADLAVFSEDLLSVFRHELTHAYTFNLKNGFWRFIGNVFGDPASPEVLTVSSGLAEGATMTSEASSGEGRLNCEFSKQIVKQAKLEGKFPGYNDVQGASTVFPYGSYYYFNGAFDQWLQEKYGYKKYAEWWYRLVNGKNFAAGAFKKVYGIKLKNAWKQFEEEYPVPQIDGNPLTTGFVTDYFSGTNVFSSENLAGPLYESLSSSNSGVLWIEGQESGVFYNGKKIFTQSHIDSAKLSSDGRFIAVTYYDLQSAAIQRKVKLYDTQTKNIIPVDGSGYADATVIRKKNQYFLVSMGFSSIRKWIDVKEIVIQSDGKKVRVNGKQKIDMPLNTMPGYFVDAGNNSGVFAYVKKAGLNYSIIVTEIGKNQIYEYSLPYEKMIVRDLSYSASTGEVLFSWTKPDSMPRLGKFNIDSEEFTLYENDISGGIFNPVRQNDGKILYSGHFYSSYRLLVLDESKLTVSFEGAAGKNEYFYSLPENKIETVRVLEKSKPYNPFAYTRGLFVPLSDTSIISMDPMYDSYGSSVYSPFGLTFQSSDPWGGLNYGLSAGVTGLSGLGSVKVSLSGGTDSSLFKWDARAQVDMDFQNTGVKQFYGFWGGRSVIPFGFHSRIGLSENLLAGHVMNNNLTLIESISTMYYSNGFYSGPGILEYAGFQVGCKVELASYTYKISEKNSIPLRNIIPYINVFIPKLIPVNCREGLVYNLPASLSVSMYDKDSFAAASADIVLFRHEVQRADSVFGLVFLQNYSISTGYFADFALNKEQSLELNDILKLSGNMWLTFTGSSSIGVTLSMDVLYKYRNLKPDEKPVQIRPGFEIHM